VYVCLEYCDLKVYCSDGEIKMNRLVLGLLFPVITGTRQQFFGKLINLLVRKHINVQAYIIIIIQIYLFNKKYKNNKVNFIYISKTRTF